MGVMTSMRTKMHIVLWGVLILFVLSMTIGGLVGGADIIDQLLGKTNPAEAIGVVNGEKIPPDFFNQLVNQQLEQYRANGQQVTDQMLESVRNQVWDNIIRENLISSAIDEMGITATDEEVVFHLENNPPSFLRTMPAFMTNGVFDQQKYLQAIKNPEGNEWAPVEQIMKTSVIPNYKLQKMLSSSVTVSDNEVREEYIKQNVQFTIDAVHITERSVDETDLAITENEIKRSYNDRKDEFEQPETRDLRFVFWKKEPQKRDTVSTYENALDIIDQLNSGEDFVYMANIYSEDPGNVVSADSARGGDLGWFEKGQMVKSFSDAAFSARKGQVVGPVLSQFGYHVIKINDKRRTNGKDQVNAAHILLKITVGAETRDALRRDATLFSYDAQDYGFDAALDTHSVFSTVISLKEEDIIINPIGQFRNAVRWAFYGEIGEISSPMENDDYYSIFLLNSETPAGNTPMEDVREQIERDLKMDKISVATKYIANNLRKEIDNGKTFSEIQSEENDYDYIIDETNTLNRGFPSLVRSNFVNGALLSSAPGDVIGPVKTARGNAIIFVKNISEIETAEYEVRKDIVKNSLLSNKQSQVFENWLKDLRDKADIEDFRKYHF